MKEVKKSFYKGLAMSFIVMVVAFIAQPKLAVAISGVAGGCFGFFFAIIGLSDDELQRLNKRKVKS